MCRLDHRKVPLVLASLILVAAFPRFCPADAPLHAVAPALQNRAISILRAAMKESKDFEKVHAAEALVWTGHPEGVKEYYLEQERTAGSASKYRIGIWRVLYRTGAGNPAVQQKYLQKLLAVLSDPKAEERETAAETLGKLRYAGAGHVALVRDLAAHGKGSIAVSARWILANSGKAEDEAHLAECLRSRDPQDRLFAAYAFRFLPTIRPATLKVHQDLAAAEPVDGEVRCYALGTLYTHRAAAQREAVKQELLKYAATGNTEQRYEACMALANWPTADMIPVVEKLLGNKPSDERVGAAYVLLRIGQPRNSADPNH